jgi:hypothetical protein
LLEYNSRSLEKNLEDIIVREREEEVLKYSMVEKTIFVEEEEEAEEKK